jgi:hypothetical protein
MVQNFTDEAKANAVSSLSANVEAYGSAIESIAADKTVKSKFFELDFLLVGITPLEIVPSLVNQVTSSVSKIEALGFLEKLSKQYNDEFRKFSATLKARHKHSRVFFYDLASLVSPFVSRCVSAKRTELIP